MKKEYIKFDHTVHYNIAGRKRYKRKMLLVFGLLVLVLIGCSAMYFFGNVTWDPEAGFSPEANPTEWWQILLIVLATVITIGALVGTFLYCFFDIKKFYLTQAIYFQTPKFKQAKAEALKQDLVSLKKSTIKWYKKLGYLTGQEKREILGKQKELKRKKKEVPPEKEKAPKD